MQNMRFRVFVNPVEEKVWAIGIGAYFESLDFERTNEFWTTTLWDRANESPKHHFHFNEVKPLHRMKARVVLDEIQAKRRDGYFEVLLPMIESNWGFVLDPTSVEPTLVPNSAGVEDEEDALVSNVALTDILEIDEKKLERAGYIAIDI
ncbi:hypothetical protein HW932_21275 [Allochromatium humboldtianum]|uniref:Uncharacterized protein n=1 Tax=Allochromatium humboldtianum TaxID=504901 RepID=A0A850REK0_9GAMM|nr:hypothetical protein [Allochromatium humboldtianum]NVZ11778.1 hypothetical protein [Allochromatium humboldtianum]